MRLYLAFMLLCVWAVFASNCSSVKTASQRRRLQVRRYQNVDYDTFFHIAKRLIQEDGYQLKTEDFSQGILSATLRNFSAKGSPLSFLGGFKKPSEGEFFEISMNIFRLSEKEFDCRLSLQKVTHHSLGEDEGQEVFETGFYDSFFGRISKLISGDAPKSVSPEVKDKKS
jgi:hypothetical protein